MELNKNRITQLILLDLEKVFDTVWHEALIHKLQKIGTPTSIVNIIHNYLLDRQFYVTIQGTKSKTHAITAGPQGSILGLTLFSIYINDIPTTTKTQIAIYALLYTHRHGTQRKQSSTYKAISTP